MAEQDKDRDTDLPGEQRPHKPADDREEVYFDGPPLLRAELGRTALCLLIAAVIVAIPVGGAYMQWFSTPWWGWLAAIVAAVLTVAVPIIQLKVMRFRITNYRIDFERGILARKIDTLELWHVDDIQFRQSLLERILGVGTITVLSNDDTTPRLEMPGLPRPRPLFDSLKQRIIAVKRQRGVIKMDLG
jgi:membrane protein YdbS with pleckstrin-like domain